MNEKALEKSLGFLKDWLRFMYERDNVPGFVVAVSHKGKVLFNEAYGQANIEENEQLKPDHIFRIASHSKTFTATAILQLQERGKLKLDDPVADYVPWLKQHHDKRFLNVTIRQVLSHGAGMIRDGLDSNYWQLDCPFPSLEQFKQDMLEAKLVIDNNIKLKYSNYGYSLLGCVVEAASGQSYKEFIVGSIIQPLGLRNTGVEYVSGLVGKLVTGYTRADFKGKTRRPIKHINTHAMAAATGFYSTSEDLCAFYSALIIGSKKLLSDESKKEMQKAQWQAENVYEATEYGLGLEIAHPKKRRTFGHGGGFPGQVTKTICYPENELVVTVLMNCIDGRVGYAAKNIFNLICYFQDNWQTPKKEFVKFEGRYMSLWSIFDVVVLGDKLLVGYSDSWELFDWAEELVRAKDNEFKITKADSFASEGESAQFNLNQNGEVKSVTYAGANCLPEKRYMELVAIERNNT